MSNWSSRNTRHFENPYAPNEHLTNGDDSSRNSSSVSRELTIADLSKVSFGTYRAIIRLLLARAGYEVVGSLGRDHLRSYKANGGADLIVGFQSVQGPIKVLVQVKQETRKLQRRYVDELRGVMQRTGVSHGLIITLGTASRPALTAAEDSPGQPVSILQGDELLRSVRDTLLIRDDNSLNSLGHVRLASQPMAHSVVRKPIKERTESAQFDEPLCSEESDVIMGRVDRLLALLLFLLGVALGAALK